MRGRRIAIGITAAAVLLGAGVGATTFLDSGDASGRPADRAVASTTSSTTTSTTTTTTLGPLTRPPTSPSGIVQPLEARLPYPPADGLGDGARGPLVSAYQQRFVDLRFDPGPVDGEFGLAMTYSVQGLQKLAGLPVTGVIGPAETDALNRFTYPEPLQPRGEPNRTEVDIAKQVLVLYEGGQPRLITTASSGSGEHYCYEQPRVDPTERVCEVANTPSGRFQYYLHRPGWDVGVLGGLYNPFYFNGGIAVHGYQSVPAGPASHGCVRIPMHIAEYFPSIVKRGDAVYVFGGSPAAILSRESLVPTPAPTTTPPPTDPPVTAPTTTSPPPDTTTTTLAPPTSTT